MSNRITYGCLLLALLFCGCTNADKWNVTLKRTDKKPYGTALAYESLQYYFPSAKTEALKRQFQYTNIGTKTENNLYGSSMLVLVGLKLYITEKEWYSLLQFAADGNEIVIFGNQLDDKIAHDLEFENFAGGGETKPLNFFNKGRDNLNTLYLPDEPKNTYGYSGRSLKSYFTLKTDDKKTYSDITDDTDQHNKVVVYTNADTLSLVKKHGNSYDYKNGQIVNERQSTDMPDCIRYQVGQGHITLHAAPLVLSNYFLLQDGNRKYLDGLWQNFPRSIAHIYWQEYLFREPEDGESGLSALLRYPATRLALILGGLALLLFVLFEGKRKQRIVPIIDPLKNESVTFAETVGRLYYNKGNHANLAEKMIQQFLEWVRTHYHMNTNQLNDAFILQLAVKSGVTENTVRSLLDMIQEVRVGGAVDEAYLYQLYNTIESFYKNQRT